MWYTLIAPKKEQPSDSTLDNAFVDMHVKGLFKLFDEKTSLDFLFTKEIMEKATDNKELSMLLDFTLKVDEKYMMIRGIRIMQLLEQNLGDNSPEEDYTFKYVLSLLLLCFCMHTMWFQASSGMVYDIYKKLAEVNGVNTRTFEAFDKATKVLHGLFARMFESKISRQPPIVKGGALYGFTMFMSDFGKVGNLLGYAGDLTCLYISMLNAKYLENPPTRYYVDIKAKPKDKKQYSEEQVHKLAQELLGLTFAEWFTFGDKVSDQEVTMELYYNMYSQRLSQGSPRMASVTVYEHWQGNEIEVPFEEFENIRAYIQKMVANIEI